MKSISVLTLFCIALAGCGPDHELAHIHRFAGPNVTELKKVLDHFREDPDTLKLAAARFLFDHMGLHYFIEDPHMRQKVELVNQYPEDSTDRIEEIMDSYEPEDDPILRFSKRKIIADAAIIDSEFLINHIEQSFRNWRSYEWAGHLTFDQFCEYLLPYKITNSKPEPWLDEYYEHNKWLLNSISRTDVETLLDTIDKNAKDRWRWHFLGLSHRLGPLQLENVRAGDCTSFTEWVTYRCRSLGMPVVYIYTPQWANHRRGHAWNAFIGADGKIEWHTIFSQDPRTRVTKAAKLFMRTYSRQETSFKAYADQTGLPPDDIPRYLHTSNFVDITDSLVPTTDVRVQLTRKNPDTYKHVFLCIFNNSTWQAIHWGIIEQQDVVFSSMARDVLYLPMFYKKSKYYPAGDPVIIPFEGPSVEVRPALNGTVDMILERKYPLGYNYMFYDNRCMVGSVFSGSSDSSFTVSEKLGTLSVRTRPNIDYSSRWRDRLTLDMYWKEVPFEQTNPYRYIQIKPSSNEECRIGELEFYDEQNQKVTGRVTGSTAGPEAVFDGFEGEDYIDDNPGGWAKIDFGKPVKLSRIRFLFADDSNRIQTGDRYELFYWNDEWISLGKQIASERYLHYKGPAGALYWLRNLDRGVEERIFTYDDKQVWW